jgi:hypothetical protein
VPRAAFARITGDADFPPEVRREVDGDALAYRGNAALAFRLGAVAVSLETRWELGAPAAGGDMHRASIRGTRAEIRVEQDASTGFRRRLSVWPPPGATAPRRRRGEAGSRLATGGRGGPPPRARGSVAPANGLRHALERAMDGWQRDHPGLAIEPVGAGWEIRIPQVLDAGHESHFPLVLDEFLSWVERGAAPAALGRDVRAKYELLAEAAAAATDGPA